MKRELNLETRAEKNENPRPERSSEVRRSPQTDNTQAYKLGCVWC